MEKQQFSRAELRDFYDDYAIALDDFDLDRWAGFFVEDCLYRVVSRENFDEQLPISTMECRGIAMVRDRIAALRETTVFEPRRLRHLVSCVSNDAAAAASRANFAVFECLSDRESHVLMVGRYMDKVVRQDGALKFKERVCVYDDYRVRTSLIFPV